MQNKVIFLDRDGVINIEKDYLYKIEDFEFIDGIFEACRYFIKRGFKIIIVTNQSGINRGYYTKNDFVLLTNWMKEQFLLNGIKITDVFFCPHTSEEECGCRKPNTQMIEQASKKYNINLCKSWFIGDKNSDIQCAINSKIKYTIQVKSGHIFDVSKSKANFVLESIKYSTAIIT